MSILAAACSEIKRTKFRYLKDQVIFRVQTNRNKPSPQKGSDVYSTYFSLFPTFTTFETTNTFNTDIQTLLNNLHEEVSCSVCMRKYNDPKQLPCLHSFYHHCLNGIKRTSGRREKIACPVCRQEFKVPGKGNQAALPTNFRINSLLDVLAIRECNTTGFKCGNCDKRSKESHYCFQCCAFWCGECITFHNEMKSIKIIMRWHWKTFKIMTLRTF